MLANLQVGHDTLADLFQHPGGVHTWHVRHRHVLELCCPRTIAPQSVSWIDRGCVDPDAQFAGAGIGLRQVQDAQHLWITEFGQAYSSHLCRNTEAGQT
jgi:hypothetical protein